MDNINRERTGWKKKIIHELTEYWLSVLYLALFFGFFTTYRRLLLAHYDISYTSYGFAAVKALVLAKVILVAEGLRLGRGFENSPLIVPTLYKAFLFTICAALFNVIESMVGSFFHGRDFTEAVAELMSRYNYEWLSAALVVFFAFIPFFALRELRQVLGKGVVFRLFFLSRSAIENVNRSEHITLHESDDSADA